MTGFRIALLTHGRLAVCRFGVRFRSLYCNCLRRVTLEHRFTQRNLALNMATTPGFFILSLLIATSLAIKCWQGTQFEDRLTTNTQLCEGRCCKKVIDRSMHPPHIGTQITQWLSTSDVSWGAEGNTGVYATARYCANDEIECQVGRAIDQQSIVLYILYCSRLTPPDSAAIGTPSATLGSSDISGGVV